MTGEDCLVLDVHCSDAGRLEQVVDSLARFGPVSTALVLRDYPDKPLTPHLNPEIRRVRKGIPIWDSPQRH